MCFLRSESVLICVEAENQEKKDICYKAQNALNCSTGRRKGSEDVGDGGGGVRKTGREISKEGIKATEYTELMKLQV
jgi:hypothetical protein